MTTISVSAKSLKRQREDLAGSEGTGSNPSKIFTLTTTSDIDIVEVYLDGLLLKETTQYTKSNSAKTITMVNTAVFNSQNLAVIYNV